MKIFSSSQIRKWDADTIKEQAILSIDLMERAAIAIYQWLVTNEFISRPLHIFCGKGNNGGDGLILGRMLLGNGIDTYIYVLETGKAGSPDFQENLKQLHEVTSAIHFIQEGYTYPLFSKKDIVIDAIFGSGLNRPVDGTALQLIEHINKSGAPVVSIDIPSGLFTDKSTKGSAAIEADFTLSFQTIKPAFLLPENDKYTGQVHLLDIGLSRNFEMNEPAAWELTDEEIIEGFIHHRNKFSHKGNFGHAALVAGSYGMMGAAVLATKACLVTGVGKLTSHIPFCGYGIIQSAAPEAMCKTYAEKYINELAAMDIYEAIGIGPGIGIHNETGTWLRKLFKTSSTSLVLDADALNAIAMDAALLTLIPANTVITPHPKEFEKLFGKTANDFERIELAVKKAAELNIYIVLKGHYTAIITPRGKVYFNNTGNAGMAKAGMGDVLTGIITGLLAQGYALPEAALLGVWIHGLAGDIAAEKYSMEAMQATDLVNCMGDAWKQLQS